jgi:hypothetical protein
LDEIVIEDLIVLRLEALARKDRNVDLQVALVIELGPGEDLFRREESERYTILHRRIEKLERRSPPSADNQRTKNARPTSSIR